MDKGSDAGINTVTGQQRLLSTLEQLLAIEGTSVKSAMNQASDLIVNAIKADKSDAFLYDPASETLVAEGTSNTPMGARQRQIGLDRLPLANDGREADVFHTGQSYITGHAEQDPKMPVGLTKSLGVRSSMITPLVVNGERRGVMQACSAQPDAFTQEDLSFLEAVGYWVGTVAHRAELVERIAQDAAMQARQVVAEELVTVLAHDLRNYITPLRGRLELLLRRARRQGDQSAMQDAEAAFQALGRLQALITDLLDVGRLEQGIFTVSQEPMDLVELVQAVTGVMQTRPLDIRVLVPDELKIEGDPARIRQALENLIANALKHSPKGVPIEIDVASETTEDNGKRAIITVSDEGPGVAPELMPRLFTRFAAGPGSTGLGLGLYLARSIAEAHGGTLTVDFKAGQGTSFRLSLPAL